MQYLVSKGAPKEKLLMGIPFYGQSFTLSKTNNYGQGVPSAGPGEAGEYTKQPGMLAYYEICNRVRNQRWIINRDAGATGPFAYYREQWVSYEDVQSVREKADYIKNQGFGGAVAWTIDLDDFNNRCCGGAFPLLTSLNRGLGLIPDKPMREDCTKPPQPVTPSPPQTTTGIDSGARPTTEHVHHEHPTTSQKPVTWWSTKPTTTSQAVSTWWPTSTTSRTTTTKWTTSRTTTRTTTTRHTTPSWQSTTIPPPSVVMPEVDKPAQTCQTGEHRPDPHNCNAYYRCVLGELRKQYCAGGLHWNKERNICDWPSSAKCEARTPSGDITTTFSWQKPTTSSWQKPTTSSWQKPTTSSWQEPTTSSWQKPTTYRPTWQRPSTTNRGQTKTTTTRTTTTLQLVEDCNNGQYYPHEQCSSFYVCVNGELVTQRCAPGLHWNVEDGMCDWKFKVTCLGRKELAQKLPTNQQVKYGEKPQPYSSCGERVFAPYPGDCTKYLHCLWGKYDVFNCAPGLHWNHVSTECFLGPIAGIILFYRKHKFVIGQNRPNVMVAVMST